MRTLTQINIQLIKSFVLGAVNIFTSIDALISEQITVSYSVVFCWHQNHWLHFACQKKQKQMELNQQQQLY